MKKVLAMLLISSSLLAFKGKETIPWQEAGKHYYEYVTVIGQVYSTYAIRKVCFINFARDWRKTFTVVIFRSAWKNFKTIPPCSMYEGHTIAVTGTIKPYRGKPEIIVNSPKYIRILQ